MRRRILYPAIGLLLVALAAGAQQAQPEHRDDKYQDDPHAFCYKGNDDGSAHACACTMVCGPDVNGNAVQQETTACSMYCSKQRCVCHADEHCGDQDAL